MSKFFHVNNPKSSKLIWFHAASIGEMKSIIPIIIQLQRKKTNIKFLVTTITLSSANLFNEKMKNFRNIYHRFLPLDVGFLMKKFIKEWNPAAVFLVDSEIWPNLIINLKKKNIPIAIINARITKKTFNKWMLIKGFANKIFSSINLSLSSNLETKKFLKKLNVKKNVYAGNIKFIGAIEKIKTKRNNTLKGKRFWCAASTHNNEELLCIQTHIMLKSKFGDLITVIAPRHIQRTREVKAICENLNLDYQIIHKGEKITKDKEIIIVNSFGVLNEYFNFAKSVFIGKSMIKKFKDNGGQNPIEAAKLGCKIYHGPYVYNFKEIYKILKKKNIAQEINSPHQLAEKLTVDLINKGKKNMKNSKILINLEKKILRDTMKNIKKFLT